MALKFLNNGYFAGKVGIGIETPGGNLHVVGDTGSSGQIYLSDRDNGTGTGDALLINKSGTSAFIYNRDGGQLSFGTNNVSDNLVIANTGNVGIGTTSPTTKLNVAGDISVSSGSYLAFIDSNIGYNKIGRNTSVGGIQITTGASATMNLLDNGNVGIGTTAPSQKLHISGDMRLTGAFRDRVNSQGAANYVLTSTGSNGTQWVDASGSSIIGGPYLPLAGGTMTGSIDFGTNNRDISMTDSAGAVTRVMVLNTSNTMYIGPVDTYAGGSILYGVAAGVSYQRFYTGAVERLRIAPSGNVGIGLTNPADRLDLYDSDDNVGMYFHTATSGTGGGNGLRVGQNNANAFVWNYEATPLSLATDGTARLTINATGGIRFNTGYGAGTLVTDASGNITVSSGGGAGGPYLPLAGGTMTGNTDHNDNVYSKYGTADQLRIWNNGSNSYIFNYTSGNINIGNDAVDKDVIFYADRGDGLEDVFFRLDGSETNGTTVLGVTLFPDKSQARFGDSGDLRIYHDGTNSYLQNYTGELYIRNNSDDKDIFFQSDDGSGGVATYFQLDGSHTQSIAWKDIHFVDGVKAKFGDYASPDLQIYHDGSNSYITDSGTGDLIITADNDLTFKDGSGNIMANMNASNSVELMFGNVKKFETTSTGVTVTGQLTVTNGIEMTAGNFNAGDGERIRLGNSADFQIYHSGTHSFIDGSNGEGSLYIRPGSGGTIQLETTTGTDMIVGTSSAVTLYSSGNSKLSTGAVGVGTATTAGGTLIDGWITTTQANAVNNTTIATTAYVNNKIALIPAGLVFQGTWNADTNSPTLTSGSGTTGNFYIVSTPGSTNLDGITDWKVGDWAVFVEQGASDQWEKVDNSSVLDGSGTGQTVALWSGSGTSNTLTDAPITVGSGNTVSIGTLTSGSTGSLIVNQEGGVTPVAKFLSRVNKAIVQISDNDTTGYISSEGGFFSLGSAGGVNEANINISTTNSNVGIGISTTSDGDLTLNAPKLHVKGPDTSGAYNLVARFQGGNDADSTGAAILINHSNDRGLLIEAGRKDGDREVAYFNVVGSSGGVMPMLTMGKFGSDYNVGIGTTSPGRKLEVDFTGSVYGAKFTRSDATGSSLIEFANSAGVKSIIGYDAGVDGYKIGTASATNFVVKQSGNVGIGTTSPISTLQTVATTTEQTTSELTDAGSRKGLLTLSGLNNQVSGAGGGVVFAGNSTTSYAAIKGLLNNGGGNTQGSIAFSTRALQTDTALTERMRVHTNGNVGIGTASPAQLLSIYKDSGDANFLINSNNGASQIFFGDTESDNIGAIRYDHGSNYMRFSTNAAETMRIDSSGNVMIGNTNASAKLDIRQDTGYAFRTENASGYTFRVEADTGNIEAAGSIQMADDTATASATKVGTMRYRTATNEPVAVTGIDFITNGDFATDTDWTKSSNVSISGGQATFTANSAAQYIIQGSLWPANSLSGQKVQLTYTVISNSLNAGDFRIGGYTGASAFTLTGLPTTVGTHSVTLDVRTSAGDDNAIDLYVTNAATSGVFVIDNVALIEVTEEDASYADMCMQTGASTYEWVNIVRNTY